MSSCFSVCSVGTFLAGGAASRVPSTPAQTSPKHQLRGHCAGGPSCSGISPCPQHKVKQPLSQNGRISIFTAVSGCFLHPRAFSAPPCSTHESNTPYYLVSQPLAELKEEDGARGKHADSCQGRRPDSVARRKLRTLAICRHLV